MREDKPLGRPREFDAGEALAKVMAVFWAQGFEGTSMSDLVAATGLKKGSLYAAFGDKRAMYLKALSLYDRTAIDATVQGLTGSGPALARLDAFLQLPIDAVIRRQDRRGCFLCNASLDQAAVDLETQGAVTEGIGRLAEALDVALADLPAPMIDDESRRAQAQHLLSVYFGLRVLARGGHPPNAMVAAKDAALRNLRPAHRT